MLAAVVAVAVVAVVAVAVAVDTDLDFVLWMSMGCPASFSRELISM
jgi:hypothetical protein